jgi:hypothetical protein
MDGTEIDDISAPRGNFLTSTGLKWVDLGYEVSPSFYPVGAEFHDSSASRNLETYFRGMEGDMTEVNITPSGNVTSSTSRYFKDSTPLASTGSGVYDTDEWNATNHSMEQVDPDSVEGLPDTECVGNGESSHLTEGKFDFHDYQSDSFLEYDVINVQMGGNCDGYIRSVKIDKDQDGDYSDRDEGPFLNNETVYVENKTFTVSFPSQEALETGEVVEFVYRGKNNLELVSYRDSFKDFSGEKLARIGYEEEYNPDEKKLVAALIHWMSDETAEFGASGESDTSTEAIGGVKENTFIPYMVAMRWN